MLALYPATSMEQPQHGSKRISIDADGRAFVIGKEKCKGTGSSASLILSGLMQTEDDEESKFEDLSGVLTVGSTEYAIQKAEGEVNNKGRMEINGKTMSGDRKLELVLHGSMNEDNVAFDCPESKLSSMYFLSLAGEITFEADTTSTSTTNSETATVTVTDNRTFTETVTETVTEGGTNSTITVTETVTRTETNSTVTITETVTTTVANTTLTVTTSVANSTSTVPPS